jgi:hypothetical protein
MIDYSSGSGSYFGKVLIPIPALVPAPVPVPDPDPDLFSPVLSYERFKIFVCVLYVQNGDFFIADSACTGLV